MVKRFAVLDGAGTVLRIYETDQGISGVKASIAYEKITAPSIEIAEIPKTIKAEEQEKGWRTKDGKLDEKIKLTEKDDKKLKR